mmetsp:Transcript_102322/g.196355  ORF Transcript_102322/g.196355 Transcript_102322/m.196355 type:complete len:405 (-) Transcript_102322:101-1315(-)
MLLVLSRLTLWGIAIGASTADPLTCSWVGLCAVEEGLQMLQTTARKNGPALHSDDSSVQNQEKTKSEPGRKLTSLAGNSSSLGVVYSICGDTMYWNELSDSIATVTEKENVSITVFTLPGEMHKCKGLASRFGIKCVDAFKSIKQMSPKTSRLAATKKSIIDNWQTLALHGLESRMLKMSSILLSPYNYSLFLDTDTHMCEPLNQLAVRLGDLTNFDMLGALNHLGTLRPYDGKSADAYKKENGIPEAYKEINTGVLFVHTDRIQVLEFVAEWMLEYMKTAEDKIARDPHHNKTTESNRKGREIITVPDQLSFMKVLWQSTVKGSITFYGLPPQWNMKNWRSSLKWQDYGHSKDVVEISDKDWPDVSLQEHSLLGDSCCPRVKMDSKGRSPDLPVLIDHACKSK